MQYVRVCIRLINVHSLTYKIPSLKPSTFITAKKAKGKNSVIEIQLLAMSEKWNI